MSELMDRAQEAAVEAYTVGTRRLEREAWRADRHGRPFSAKAARRLAGQVAIDRQAHHRVRRPAVAVAAFVVVATLLAGAARVGPTDYDLKQDARIDRIESTLTGQSVSPSPTLTVTPTVQPSASPTASPTGWSLVFQDDFDDRTIAAGHFLDGATGMDTSKPWKTADGRYLVFRAGWKDTSQHGRYDPSIISVGSGLLDYAIATRDGYPRTATITPLPRGSSASGGLVGAVVEVRSRADWLVNYKGVWLLWADLAQNNDMLTYGEIDGPESSFQLAPKAYLHYVAGSSSSDQFAASYPAGTTWQEWHVYRTVWFPGTSVEWLVDGRSVAKVTNRVPTAAMHFNLQTETATGGAPIPDPSISGHVQIDYVRIWVQT